MSNCDRLNHIKLSLIKRLVFAIIFLIMGNNCALVRGQIVPDETLGAESSQVTNNLTIDNLPAKLIEGGAQRGNNLFHSFSQFSIETGQGAYFANPESITNIFSRVTGGDVSEIMGTLGVRGNADLFFINPNGIIFGENSSLDINGSFIGSSADSILFDNGFEFGAVNPEAPPLLTVNMPLGLNLGNNPGVIINRSIVENGNSDLGLSVLEGNNLSLVGGKIVFEGGKATARGGKIELGGLFTAGTVSFTEDGDLNFSEGVSKADVFLSRGALVDVSSRGGGDIVINARNLELTENTFLKTGIKANSTVDNTNDIKAGDIIINLTDKLTLDLSRILNQVEPNGVGNAGQIEIITGSIKATKGGQIDATTSGRGNAGNIIIHATEDLIFDGEGFDNLDSSVVSLVNENAEGNAGDVTISTEGNLTLTNGGRVDASSNGQGDGGSITINAKGDVSFIGEDSEELGSGVTSLVNLQAAGDSGDITVSTQGDLTLTNRGRVDASNNSMERGNGGNITIDVGNNLIIDGEENSKGFGSGINSLNNGGQGNSGDITVSTQGNLTLINKGRIDANNNSMERGNGGNVTIDVGNDLTIDGDKNSRDFGSGINSLNNGGRGDSGDITVLTQGKVNLNFGSLINTSNNGQGNGGDITIYADGDIIFDGDDINGDGSGAISLIGQGVEGNAGNITISTLGKLSLTGGGRIDASSNRGEGNAGSIRITVADDIVFEGEDSRGFGSGATSQVNPGVEGNSGGINIFTEGNLTLKDGGRVDASTNALGNAGFIDISALGDITFEGKAINGNASGVTSQVNPLAKGNAGGVTISTQGNLTLTDGGRIDASINAQGDGGNIQLEISKLLLLRNNSSISSRAGILGSGGDGGNINIDAGFLVAFPSENSDIDANAFQGRGGVIQISTQSIFGIAERNQQTVLSDITASSQQNPQLDGTITIETIDYDLEPELTNLPEDFIDLASLTVPTCPRNNTDSNTSKFIVTGRGGLPPEPEDNFRLPAIAIESDSTAASSPQPQPDSNKILEATGWTQDATGKISLIAPSTTTALSYDRANSAKCNF